MVQLLKVRHTVAQQIQPLPLAASRLKAVAARSPHMIQQLRERLADLLSSAAGRLAPAAAAAAAAPQDPLEDFQEDALDEELPTIAPTAISERVTSRSLRTLKLEAFEALGALHSAHVAGVVVWDNRRIQAFANQLNGSKAAKPATLQLIVDLAKQWSTDEVVLAHALGQLHQIQVDDAPLLEMLAPDEAEAEVVDAVLSKCEAECARMLLEDAATVRDF